MHLALLWGISDLDDERWNGRSNPDWGRRKSSSDEMIVNGSTDARSIGIDEDMPVATLLACTQLAA